MYCFLIKKRDIFLLWPFVLLINAQYIYNSGYYWTLVNVINIYHANKIRYTAVSQWTWKLRDGLNIVFDFRQWYKGRQKKNESLMSFPKIKSAIKNQFNQKWWRNPCFFLQIKNHQFAEITRISPLYLNWQIMTPMCYI